MPVSTKIFKEENSRSTSCKSLISARRDNHAGVELEGELLKITKIWKRTKDENFKRYISFETLIT